LDIEQRSQKTDFDPEEAEADGNPAGQAAVDPFFVIAESSHLRDALVTISPQRLVLSRITGASSWQASPEILSLRLRRSEWRSLLNVDRRVKSSP
jgi:hypothetical protein